MVAVLLLAVLGITIGVDASVLYLYNVLPSIALVGLISFTSRGRTKGRPAVAAGTMVFTAFNLLVLIPMFVDDSSTGVLLYLFLPLYTGAFVILIALVAGLVHVLRERRGPPHNR